MADTATNAQTPPTTFSRWIPSLPTIFNPFANEGARSGEQTIDDNNRRDILSTRPSALSTTSYHDSAHSGPPSPSRSSFFAEPSPSSNQSDRGSPKGSVDGKRSKKSRPKTTYSVCHPPPESKARQKLHRRPRSLLQLHRLSEHRRPLPAYDVIPSANFSMRMHSAVGKVFRSRHGICPNDLVVLQAEKYSNREEDENDQEARDMVGLVCKGGRKDKDKDDNQATSSGRRATRILMAASGEDWEAKVLSNGGYEFFSPDSHGLGQTVRWVPKRNKDGSTIGRDGTRKFNFSTISPNTRRHPVIASLSKTALDINDTYKLPDPAGGTPMGTPQKSTAPILLEEDDDPTQQVFSPDQHLRDLITLTAIWVTVKEGWSTSIRFDDDSSTKMPGSAPPSAPGSPSKPFHTNSHGHVPSLSSLYSTPGSPNMAPSAGDKGRTSSMKAFSSDLIRRTSLLGKSGKRNSYTAASDDGNEGVTSRNSSVANTTTGTVTGRTRADSSSTILVHRAASNRRRNNQLKEMIEDRNVDGTSGGRLEEVSTTRENGLGIENEEESSSEDDEDEAEERKEARKAEPGREKGSKSGSRTSGTTGDATPERAVQSRAAETSNGKAKGRAKREKPVRMPEVQAGGEKKKGWKRLFCGVAR